MCRTPSVTQPHPPPMVHIAVTSEKPTAASQNPNIKKLGFIWAGVIVALLLIICTITVVIVGLDIQKQQKLKTNENINKTVVNPVAQAFTNENEKSEVKTLENVVKIISRKEWKSLQTNGNIPELKQPIKYVILCHTSGRFCETTKNCSAVIRWIQNYYITTLKKADISYNFILGGDANMYEGIGWYKQNDLMNNSISIGVIGNYIYDVLTEEMITETKLFLKHGVETGLLDKHYFLVPHNQTRNTLSPGLNIYREIKNWDHYTSDYII